LQEIKNQMKVLDTLLPATVNAKAQTEFDAYVAKLRAYGIRVVVVSDTDEFDTPDALFPNNWISFHQDGTVALYPMFAKNRRLDRVNQKAYCALSPRADEDLFIEFCEDFEYTPVIFTAKQTVDGERKEIYHTNVMMCLAETFAVICLDSIDDKKERKNIVKNLKEDGKQVIGITEAQVHNFAGNMLQVRGANDERFLVMSQAAYASLTPQQIAKIENHCKIISSSLDTIEACGGGSARCMMAEVFLPKA